MLKKYSDILEKFKQLEQSLQEPAVINDPPKLKEVSQEYTDLKTIADKIAELASIEKNILETERTAETDQEMRELAEAELLELNDRRKKLETELADLTRPRDPLDKKKRHYGNPRRCRW